MLTAECTVWCWRVWTAVSQSPVHYVRTVRSHHVVLVAVSAGIRPVPRSLCTLFVIVFNILRFISAA